jgi:hypothetical protein
MLADEDCGETAQRSISCGVPIDRMGDSRNTSRCGRWLVPLICVAAAIAVVLAISQRTGGPARERQAIPAGGAAAAPRLGGCEPGIGC